MIAIHLAVSPETAGTKWKASMNIETKYLRLLAIVVAFLCSFALSQYAFDVSFDLLGFGTRQFGMGMQVETAIVLGMLMGALGLALHRRNHIMKLQEKLVERQAMEIGLQERAMNAHAIVSVTNPDARIASVNNNFLKIFGYEEHEVIGQETSLIYYGQQDDTVFTEVRNIVNSGKSWSGEHKALTKDGEILFMRCTILPVNDENGRHVKNVSLRTDITEARKADADRFLKTMLDDLQDEVFIFDVETLGIAYMNDRALRRCEWSKDEARTKSIVDTSKAFDVKFFRHHVAPLFSGDQQSVVIELPHDKGPVEIITKLFEGDDGRMLFLSVLRDITERKKLEQAKLETVSVVSHELRTPLTSIKGALRLLKSGALGSLTGEAGNVLDIADRNSDRLLTIVNDILDLEKIRAGKMKFEKVSLNLTDSIRETVEMNKGYGDEHNVKLVAEIEDCDAYVKGNADRLAQVMSNLISNAAKFSASGDTIIVSLEDFGDCWRVKVADKGPGILESVGQLIFDSFAQAEAVDGLKRKGTGLGLTITKKIIEHHSGRISYESEVGQGTTFFFELPKLDDNSGNAGMSPARIAAE